MEFPNYVVVFLWAPWLIHNLACGTAMDKCLGLQAGVVNAQFLKLSGGSAMWCSRQETTKPGVRYPPRGNNMVRDFFLRIFLNEVNILLNSGFRYWQYCKPYIQMQLGIHWVPDTRTHTHRMQACVWSIFAVYHVYKPRLPFHAAVSPTATEMKDKDGEQRAH